MKMVNLAISHNHFKFTVAPVNRASDARQHLRKFELINEAQFTVQNVKINPPSSSSQQLPQGARI